MRYLNERGTKNIKSADEELIDEGSEYGEFKQMKMTAQTKRPIVRSTFQKEALVCDVYYVIGRVH